MLKKRVFFWWGILLSLLVLFGWIYYLYNKPHGSAAGETSILSIDAGSLFREYRDNEGLADKKYLGKVIDVSGKLAEVLHNGQLEIWMLVAQPGIGGVNCQLFPGNMENHRDVKPGDQVTVKGRCTGFLMDVNLADCIVIIKADSKN